MPDASVRRELENVRIALPPLLELFFDAEAADFDPRSLVLYRQGPGAHGSGRWTADPALRAFAESRGSSAGKNTLRVSSGTGGGRGHLPNVGVVRLLIRAPVEVEPEPYLPQLRRVRVRDHQRDHCQLLRRHIGHSLRIDPQRVAPRNERKCGTIPWQKEVMIAREAFAPNEQATSPRQALLPVDPDGEVLPRLPSLEVYVHALDGLPLP